MAFWVHKNHAERFARIHRSSCTRCECGESGCVTFHSFTAAWRSASTSGLEPEICAFCKPRTINEWPRGTALS